MKTKSLIILVVTLLIGTNVYADKYKIISNMSGLKKSGDFKEKDKANIIFDGIDYKAASGSIFKRVDNEAYSVQGENYILIEFTKISGKGTDFVKLDQVYFLPEEKNRPYYVKLESGFDYGALSLPFKLRFNPNVISPNASIGFFGGYKKAIGYNWTSSFIGTIGLTGVSLNDVNSKDVENVMGFTYAGGIIFNYKSKFQAGFVIGVDMIGGTRGKNWTYENKPWIAIATGFTFLK